MNKPSIKKECCMRTIIKAVSTIIFVFAVVYSFGSGFCEGWEDGYASGYCYGKGYSCLRPLAPLCPLPRLGEDTYQGGYNRGFLAGLKAQQ
jgi:hypothetical protein